jgi:FKBP-type peptidyl-prolyl cis-trans isomerase
MNTWNKGNKEVRALFYHPQKLYPAPFTQKAAAIVMMKPLIRVLFLALVLTTRVSADESQAGLDYWNGIDSDAITTDSGLQYKVLVPGKGRKPTAKSRVTVHYRGLLLDGTAFDSSFANDEPVTFSLRRVIEGWSEGIQLMPVDSVFVFLIPPELAYGEKGSGPIPPNATLIFIVELFGVR